MQFGHERCWSMLGLKDTWPWRWGRGKALLSAYTLQISVQGDLGSRRMRGRAPQGGGIRVIYQPAQIRVSLHSSVTFLFSGPNSPLA